MMTDLDALDFYVVYFPRSAGKYFVYNYGSMTRTMGVHLHELEYLSKDNVLSIVRNPDESVASTVISGLMRDKVPDIQGAIDHHVKDYIGMYEAILDSNTLLVRFEDVVDNFDTVAKDIASRFGHQVLNSFMETRPETTSEYISTSKVDSRYDDIYEMVSNHSLIGACYNLYNQALSKCVLY